MGNFALRLINSMVGEPMDESQLLETESRIEIIRDNQKCTGLKDYPCIKDSLNKVAESLIEISKNETITLADIISLIKTNQSIIDINVNELKEEYNLEKVRLEKLFIKTDLTDELKWPNTKLNRYERKIDRH